MNDVGSKLGERPMEANLPECTRQRSFVQMADVISRRILQLLNESFVWRGVFKYQENKS
jgi:hypothetical protein